MFKFIFLIFIVSMSFAGEGFFTTTYNLPGGVRTAWASTFGITYRSSGAPASAFLVHKEVGNSAGAYGKYFFYFLTSEHVVRANNCVEKTVCSSIRISSSLGIDNINRAAITTNDLNRTFDNPEVVRISKEPDIALLKVEVDSKSFYAYDLVEIKPVPNCKIANGSAIYVIGYPGTHARPGAKGTTDADQYLNIKRWSTGFVIDQTISNLNNSGPLVHWTSTTADSLGGNSGGPAVNSNGELVGIMDSGARIGTYNSKYLGDESRQPMVPHSYLENCQAVDAFLKLGFK